MEYHMQYSPNEEIKHEKEVFVEKPLEKKIIKKKKSLFVILSVSIFSLFTLIIIYFNKERNKNDNLKGDPNEVINDDYLITTLLKSKNGKKIFLSKLEELISIYDKNNLNDDNKSESDEYKRNVNDRNDNAYKKKEGNLKIAKKEDSVNLYDVRFLMSNLEVVNSFYLFLKENNKRYDTSNEMQEKFLIFSQNHKKIEEHNRKDSLYKKRMNQFGDMPFEEFEKKYLNLKRFDLKKDIDNISGLSSYDDIIDQYKKEYEDFNLTKFDWREHNGVTPAKDQQNCGSCWAFSTVGGIESQYLIRKNERISLSEQQLVDCSDKNLGCTGGYIPLAYEYVVNNGGLCTSKEYPYVDTKPESCYKAKCEKKHTIKTFVSVPENSFKEAITFLGPISVSIAATDDFSFYGSGIYNGKCAYEVNHAVILVGFGMEEIYNSSLNKNENVYYYIIKNSWGESWGEKGFMRIETNEKGTQRKCLLGKDAYVPLID
ncbi:cysteine proteinase, putative [Plasmodium relictum]|uniref:Cysteine proteinase, putative n=1 Tax=Plasmodium relictum TaxID=85471 RepID=A0A1J1H533_PLARL|nr:cysteine proteinase, putative [Plasmodium relictum]CRH00023.1 cysteine proteinase, putative [Plasmodium relictum]